MSADDRGGSPDHPSADERSAPAEAAGDPWFDDDEDDLEPLDLGGVIWLPLAKRIGIGLAAIAAIAILAWLLV